MITIFDIFKTPDFIFILPFFGMIVSGILHLFVSNFYTRTFFLFFSIFTFIQNSYQAYFQLFNFNFGGIIKPVVFKYLPSEYKVTTGVDWFVIIDNISALHIIITGFIIIICFVHAFFNVKERFNLLAFLLFTVQLLLNVSFSCPNIFIFYICFEATLIPFFLIIAVWGSRNEFKISAAYNLIFFTLFFSVMLFGYLALSIPSNATPNFTHIALFTITFGAQFIFIFVAIISFSVKVPLIPFHSWLPNAHGEAPTIGSMLLAGIILKVGTYGFYRLLWPAILISTNYLDLKIFLIFLSTLTILVSCLLLVHETDLKRIIALYSINHIGFVIMGLCITKEGVIGSMVINASHCLSSAGLFFLVGQLYQRIHSRNIAEVRGLAAAVPFLSLFTTTLFLANMSFPITLNFIGEFAVLTSFANIFGLESTFNSNSSLIQMVLAHTWWTILVGSVIFIGIISVRFLIILLFSTKDIPEFDGNFFHVNNIKLEDAKLYEVIILSVIVVTLIFTAIFFVDISIFFDPNMSYSTRLYRSKY